MLQNFKVWATVPATDIHRAVEFYTETLGLSKVSLNDEMKHAIVEAGDGTKIEIYERAPSKADHTLATFEVKDIEKEVKSLAEKGIAMEQYDMGEIKTVDGIATVGSERAAWFKDSEGNILCIHESV
ncbi:VOC family protein [bacterium]|nr:VOC family protein [bacterium]